MGSPYLASQLSPLRDTTTTTFSPKTIKCAQQKNARGAVKRAGDRKTKTALGYRPPGALFRTQYDFLWVVVLQIPQATVSRTGYEKRPRKTNMREPFWPPACFCTHLSAHFLPITRLWAHLLPSARLWAHFLPNGLGEGLAHVRRTGYEKIPRKTKIREPFFSPQRAFCTHLCAHFLPSTRLWAHLPPNARLWAHFVPNGLGEG